MTQPCDQVENIKYMKQDIGAIRDDVREAFNDIKESVKLFQEGQDRMTGVLIDMVKTQEKLLSVADKTNENRKDLDSLGERVREDVRDLHKRINNIDKCKTTRKTDGKFDKGQISLIIGAVAGFTTFIYTLINKLIDFILTGGTPPPH